jgi:hypothetical protein
MPIDPSQVVWDDAPKIDPAKVVWDDEKPAASTPAGKQRGFFGQVGHQLGLTGRALVEGNPVVALGDLAAEPIRMGVNALRPGTFTQTGGEALADLLRLPKPEGKNEAVVQAFSKALAGSAGAPALAKVAPHTVPAARSALTWLADRPVMQVNSALGATAGQLGAQEAGAGEVGQLFAALAGGMAGPGVNRLTQIPKEIVMDTGATIGAALGHKGSIKRILTDTVERNMGDQKGRVAGALHRATEYVPGAKPTVAEAIAEANMKSPDQFGGWAVRVQKDLTGAKGVEDVLPTVAKNQAKAVAAEGAAVNRELWPVGQEKLASSSAWGGVNARNVFQKIDDLAMKPSTQGSTLIKRVLSATRRKIAGLVRDDGSIDPEALYSVRKELGNDIKTYQRATNNWDKTVSIGLEREIQKSIDDAIEASGGAGWTSEYMQPYAQRMGQLGKQEARNKVVKQISAQVKPTGGTAVTQGEVPKPPTLLNRTMMLVNFGLRSIAQDANAPVVKELTARLKDPKAFAELLTRPDKDPLKMLAMESMRRGQVAAALSATQNGE